MDGQGMKRTRVVARASSLKSLKDSARHEPAHPTLESAHSYISHLLLTDFGLRLSIPVLRYTKQELWPRYEAHPVCRVLKTLLVMSLDPTLESAHSYISHLLLTDFGLRLSIPVLSLAFGSMADDNDMVRLAFGWMGNNMVRWPIAIILVGWAIILVPKAQVNNEGDQGTQLNNRGDRGDQGTQVTTDPNNHLNQFNNEGGNQFKQGNEGGNKFNNEGGNQFKQGNEGRQVYNQGNEKVNNHGDNRNEFNNKGSNEFNHGNKQVYNHGEQVFNQGEQVFNHGEQVFNQGDKARQQSKARQGKATKQGDKARQQASQGDNQGNKQSKATTKTTSKATKMS